MDHRMDRKEEWIKDFEARMEEEIERASSACKRTCLCITILRCEREVLLICVNLVRQDD